MIDLALETHWRTARVVFEHAAIAAGALSGCLHAIRKDFDIVGTVVIALTSGLGGGLLRDMLVASGPALALRHPTLLLSAVLASGAGIVLGSRTHRVSGFLWALDALSIGLFTVAGIQRATECGLGVAPAIFLGVVTGTAGILIRDVLCRELPVLLVPGLPYATASLFGALVFFGLHRLLSVALVWSEVSAVVASAALRVIGRWRQWTVPRPDDLFRR